MNSKIYGNRENVFTNSKIDGNSKSMPKLMETAKTALSISYLNEGNSKTRNLFVKHVALDLDLYNIILKQNTIDLNQKKSFCLYPFSQYFLS